MKEKIMTLVIIIIFLVGCKQVEFQEQISEKTERMKEMQNEEKQLLMISDLNSFCDSKCSEAHKSLNNQINYLTQLF